jgi:hypothetical protein
MDNSILNDLNSVDPEIRKRGIKALVKSGDANAMRYLASLYKKDPDPDVRDLALKGGKHLQQQAANAPSQAEASTSDATDDDYVTDDAGTSLYKEDDSVYDSSRMNEPVRFSSTSDGEFNKIGAMMDAPEKPKRKMEDVIEKEKRSETDASWGDAIFDVSIYGLFQGAITFLFLVIMIVAAQNLITAFGIAFDDVAAANEVNRFIGSIGIGFTLLYSLAMVISSVVGLMITSGFIHLAAQILGGKGSFSGLLKHITIPTLIYSIVTSAIGGITMFVAFRSLPSVEELRQMQDMTDSQIEAQLQAANFYANLNSAQGLSALIALAFILYLGYLVGKNYRFGMGRGCVSLILSYILMLALACGCIFAFTALLGSRM